MDNTTATPLHRPFFPRMVTITRVAKGRVRTFEYRETKTKTGFKGKLTKFQRERRQQPKAKLSPPTSVPIGKKKRLDSPSPSLDQPPQFTYSPDCSPNDPAIDLPAVEPSYRDALFQNPSGKTSKGKASLPHWSQAVITDYVHGRRHTNTWRSGGRRSSTHTWLGLYRERDDYGLVVTCAQPPMPGGVASTALAIPGSVPLAVVSPIETIHSTGSNAGMGGVGALLGCGTLGLSFALGMGVDLAHPIRRP